MSGRNATRPEAVLRVVRRSDLPAMTGLDRLCFEPGVAFPSAQMARFFDLASLEGVVAEARGSVVAFAIGYLRRPTIAGVLTLDVHPDWRRRGIGRTLFADLLARLARAGARMIQLEVDVRNSGAIAFYRAFGFRKVGRIADYYGPGKDAFEMARPARKAGGRLRVRTSS